MDINALCYGTVNVAKFKYNMYTGIDCFRERSQQQSIPGYTYA